MTELQFLFIGGCQVWHVASLLIDWKYSRSCCGPGPYRSLSSEKCSTAMYSLNGAADGQIQSLVLNNALNLTFDLQNFFLVSCQNP